jgi:2-polyprenyl-3-methyl-5-hydroxy-6-metoxy-1,4-benzoquinol methylase
MSTANKIEIDNFETIADQWWDVNGPLKPLHKLNPTRISYIKKQICHHFDRDFNDFSQALMLVKRLLKLQQCMQKTQG